MQSELQQFSSPRRHNIHSSFPHYFYTTPAAASPPAFIVATDPEKVESLKLPPRLQYISNIRQSLRNRITSRRKVSSFTKEVDPFAKAVENVRKEDMAWCQVPTGGRRRRARSCESVPLVEEVGSKRERSSVCGWIKKGWKREKFLENLIKRMVKGSGKVSKDESCGDGVLARHRERQHGHGILACFMF